MNRRKILLAHLNSLGDCLYVTVIARQIKEIDFVDCHLTWAVNSNCIQAIRLNPHVDEIWEIPTAKASASEAEWAAFVNHAEQRKNSGDFDIIFYTQIIGENKLRYDGGIRSSTYNNYPRPIVIPQQPVIRLSQQEIDNVKQFVERHRVYEYKNVILLEFGPESFTSMLNLESAMRLAVDITTKYRDTAVILSSNKKTGSHHPPVIDASTLTFRENAELTKYCTLFIGCSSGISWLTTTDWAKPLPKIIVTDYYSTVCPSMIYDHEYAGLPTDSIIEFQENPSVIAQVYDSVALIISGNFDTVKKRYSRPVALKNYSFVYRISREGFKRGEFYRAAETFKRSNKRNGFHYEALLYLLKAWAKLPLHLVKWRLGSHRR